MDILMMRAAVGSVRRCTRGGASLSLHRAERWMSSLTERKSFGSFHSEDIEVLIRQSEEEFKVPTIAQAIQAEVLNRHHLNHSHGLPMENLAYRKALYGLDPQFTFLNHGAFGATLRPLLFESFLWREYCDSQPLRFYDRDLFPLVVNALRHMAKLLYTSPTHLLPLPNVTTGLNAICNSVERDLRPSDEVVCFSLTYGSTKKILRDLSQRASCQQRIITLPLPIMSEEDMLKQIAQQLTEHSKLLVIDAVTSNTALLMPVLQIARLCRSISPQCVVVVDGAHSLFAQDTRLDDPELLTHVSYWLSNGHKWLSAPKGCAVMWTNPALVRHMRPAVISHGFQAAPTMETHMDRGNFLSAFAWDGCRDHAAFLSLPTAISVWDTLAPHLESLVGSRPAGEDKWWVYRRYCSQLLDTAEDLLAEYWLLKDEDQAAPRSLRSPFMRLVPLPRRVLGKGTRSDCTDKDAFQLQEKLYSEYQVEVPVKCLEGRLYVRISAHVYNDIEDYKKLAIIVRNWP